MALYKKSNSKVVGDKRTTMELVKYTPVKKKIKKKSAKYTTYL